MSKSVWMRISGWLLFLAGGVFLLVTGPQLLDPENLLPWAGAFTMMIGMGLTMGANLVAHIEHMRTLKPPPEGPDPTSKGSNG